MIPTIETEHTEFKASTAQLSRAIESLVAMLNKHDEGRVLFGVLDDGTVIGQDVNSKTLKDISEAIAQRIKPSVLPFIDVVLNDGHPIISVSVIGHNKPYSANGLYLIRNGSENKKIEPEHLKDLVFVSSTDSMTQIESIHQDLTFNQLKQLYVIKGLNIDHTTFEKNMGLLSSNHRYNLLAELVADNNDFSIKVVRFKGTDKSELLVRNEYGYKCLILSMQQALEYVDSLNETRVKVDASFARKEEKLFDAACLREAWINACLHSKWSRMVPPVINIYQDRLEIVSIGGLPVDYSLEDFYLGISHPINRGLQKIMGQLGIVEQTGHGVPEIVKKYGKEAFSVSDNHIIVTLKFPFPLNSPHNVRQDISESDRKVIQALTNAPSITKEQLSKVVSLSVPRISVVLRELKEKGIIERQGSRKSGYWLVK